jgi:hypothetical protein
MGRNIRITVGAASQFAIAGALILPAFRDRAAVVSESVSREITAALFSLFRKRDISFGSHEFSEACGIGLAGSAKNFLTLSTETAKLRPSPSPLPEFTPIRVLDSLIRGPPELPGLMGV